MLLFRVGGCIAGERFKSDFSDEPLESQCHNPFTDSTQSLNLCSFYRLSSSSSAAQRDNAFVLHWLRSGARTQGAFSWFGPRIVCPDFTRACGRTLPRCEQRGQFLEFSLGECDSHVHQRQSDRPRVRRKCNVQNIRHDPANRDSGWRNSPRHSSRPDVFSQCCRSQDPRIDATGI